MPFAVLLSFSLLWYDWYIFLHAHVGRHMDFINILYSLPLPCNASHIWQIKKSQLCNPVNAVPQDLASSPQRCHWYHMCQVVWSLLLSSDINKQKVVLLRKKFTKITYQVIMFVCAQYSCQLNGGPVWKCLITSMDLTCFFLSNPDPWNCMLYSLWVICQEEIGLIMYLTSMTDSH